MEVYLIRHTAPDIIPGLIYGHLDVPLAPGFQEALNTIKPLLPFSLEAVWTSPARRCRELADALHSHVMADDRLRELHFGCWEGRTWDSLSREETEPWMQDFVHTAPPGGETVAAMQRRVEAFRVQLLQEPFRQVAVVTHAGVIRIMLARQQGIPLSDMFTLPVPYGQVFRLTW